MLAVMEIPQDPGPSQPSSSQMPADKALFVDANGQPLHVFVEASSIYGRPRIIRSLRTFGAVISHSPDHSQIILVDPETEAGIAFAKEWGSGVGQVVLDSAWVRASVEKGSPPLWYDNWGGFRIRGDPQDVNANVPDIIQSPLPTPRQTPIESTPLDRRPVGRPVPPSQLPSYNRPTTAPAGVPSPLQPPDPSPSPSPQLPLPLQNDVSTLQPPPASPAPWVPSNFAATVMDVIKHQQQNGHVANFPSWPGQMAGQLSMLQSSFAPPVSQTIPFGTSYPLFPTAPPAATIPSMHPPSPTTPFSHQERRSSTPSNSILTPSLKRRSPHMDGSNPDGFRPSQDMAPRSTADPTTNGSPRPAKQPRLSSNEPASPPGTQPPSSQRSSTHSWSHDVFTDDDGGALQFVVQIDLRNRKDVVAAIKKCGGKISSEISQADFVVLSPHSTSFADLLKSCVVHEKPAVNAQFVHDCAEQVRLLDEEAYGFGEVMGKRKRGRPSVKGIYSAPKKVVKSEKKTPSKPPSKTPTKSPKVQKPASTKSSAQIPKDDFDYPLPKTVIRDVMGRCTFTDEESEYFSRYTNYLLSADPTMSNTAISKRMHAKMPQHPQKSWDVWISKQREELAAIRKKVMIATRKQAPHVDSKPPVEPPQPAPEQSEEPSSKEVTLEDLQTTREFKAITDFLGNGGADGRTDDEVWPILAEMYPYFSEQEWVQYWDTYAIHINGVVTEMLEAQSSQVPLEANSSWGANGQAPLSS